MFKLRMCDIKITSPNSLTQVVVCTIKEAKNRFDCGTLQASLIRESSAVAWIRFFYEGSDRWAPLWPGSKQLFATMLQKCLAALKLTRLRLTPASLRAGGASWLFEAGVPVSSLKFMGRWASEKSLSSYIPEAEAASVLLSIPAGVAARIASLRSHLPFTFNPPHCSLRTLLRRSARHSS